MNHNYKASENEGIDKKLPFATNLNTGRGPRQCAPTMSPAAAVAATTKRSSTTCGDPQCIPSSKVLTSVAQIQQPPGEEENGVVPAKINNNSVLIMQSTDHYDDNQKKREAQSEEDGDKKACSSTDSAAASHVAYHPRKVQSIQNKISPSMMPLKKRHLLLHNSTKPGAYAVKPSSTSNSNSSNNDGLAVNMLAKNTAAFGKAALRSSGPEYSLRNYNDNYNSDDSDYNSSRTCKGNSSNDIMMSVAPSQQKCENRSTYRYFDIKSRDKAASHASGPQYALNNHDDEDDEDFKLPQKCKVYGNSPDESNDNNGEDEEVAPRASRPEYAFNNYDDDLEYDDEVEERLKVLQEKHKANRNLPGKSNDNNGEDKEVAPRASRPEYAFNNYDDDLEYDDEDEERLKVLREKYKANRNLSDKSNSNNDEDEELAPRVSRPEYAFNNYDDDLEDDGEDEERMKVLQKIYKTTGKTPDMTRSSIPIDNEVSSITQSNIQQISQQPSGVADYEIPTSTGGLSESFAFLPEVVAFAVDENETARTESNFRESDVRRNIIRDSVIAEIVKPVTYQNIKFRIFAVGCLVLALAFIVVGVMWKTRQQHPTIMSVSERPSMSPSLRPTADPRPTIQKVKEEGVLRCYTAWAKPLEEELCRAVAVAVIGNQAKIEPIDGTTVPWKHLFDSLKNETFDIAVLWTRTMYRDVVLGTTSSIPIYHDGIVFVGIPKFVDCADRMDVYSSECRRVRICIAEGSLESEVLLDYLPDLNVRPLPYAMLYNNFLTGKCNVIADYKYDISKKNLRVEHNYTGPYKIGTNSLTKVPLGLITRDNDAEWSDLVNWVMNILLAAEEQNITQSTARDIIAELPYRSEKLLRMYDIVAAVGNYGEIYQKSMQNIVPRDGLNLLNNGSSGLIYSYLFDGIQKEGPDPSPRSMLNNILKRGYVRCGIFTDRPGFGTFNNVTNRWEGLDADYCYALSASIFNDKDANEVFMNRTKFIKLNSSNAGYVALVNDEVDVVTGAKVRLDNADIEESVEGKGYITYSQPYFYGSNNYNYNDNQQRNLVNFNDDDALALMTQLREDDDDYYDKDSIKWSEYVFWIVSSTFYAEEVGIEQNTASDMPLVKLLGSKFQLMFQSAIATCGNYGEMYVRNVEKLYNRNRTRNELNVNPFGPQHFPIPISTT